MKVLLGKKPVLAILAGLSMAMTTTAQADITFTFQEAGNTVTMTPSGTLDTTNLEVSNLVDGWGGTGTEDNPAAGDIDIMGGTDVGSGISAQFRFSAGTDQSALENPGGPWNTDNFGIETINGSTAFTTYAGFENDLRIAGIGMSATDIVDGLWTPDQSWIYPDGTTLASLGMTPGTYAVSDAVTGETITIQIGPAGPTPGPALPVPSVGIWGMLIMLLSTLIIGGRFLRRSSDA